MSAKTAFSSPDMWNARYAIIGNANIAYVSSSGEAAMATVKPARTPLATMLDDLTTIETVKDRSWVRYVGCCRQSVLKYGSPTISDSFRSNFTPQNRPLFMLPVHRPGSTGLADQPKMLRLRSYSRPLLCVVQMSLESRFQGSSGSSSILFGTQITACCYVYQEQ